MLLKNALKYHGLKEVKGAQHNTTIVGMLNRLLATINDDETPWCSAYVNQVAHESGMETSDKLNARSWLNVGIPVQVNDAEPGDVVILWRGSPKSWKGHVGFYISHDQRYVTMLGGNQNNQVGINKYDAKRILGIRRLRPLPAVMPDINEKKESTGNTAG